MVDGLTLQTYAAITFNIVHARVCVKVAVCEIVDSLALKTLYVHR